MYYQKSSVGILDIDLTFFKNMERNWTPMEGQYSTPVNIMHRVGTTSFIGRHEIAGNV